MEKKLLGHRINLARKEQGITGEKLAERCNINATYLRQIEGGTKMPSLPVFITICKELKVTPTYLLAEFFTENDLQGIDDLFTIWKTATPKQIKMMTSMIKSALEATKES